MKKGVLSKMFSDWLSGTINLLAGIILGAVGCYFMLQIGDGVYRSYTISGNLHLASEIEKFHKENGRYPEELHELNEISNHIAGFYVYKPRGDSFQICNIEMKSGSVVVSNSSKNWREARLSECLAIANGGSWIPN